MTTPTSERLGCPPTPGTREHASYITASVVPAIMGVDPYGRTIHDMVEQLLHPTDTPEPNDPEIAEMFRWGHIAEESLLLWFKQERGQGGHMEREPAYHDVELERHFFPHLVTPDGVVKPYLGEQHNGLPVPSKDVKTWNVVECKTDEPKGIYVPAIAGPPIHIAHAVQLTAQMGVIGSRIGWLVRHAEDDAIPQISRLAWNPQAWERIVDTCTRLWDVVLELKTGGAPDYGRHEAYLELEELTVDVSWAIYRCLDPVKGA